MAVDIEDCPTSRRSGRHIIPPLAWWMTERILIDPDTKSTHIVCDSPLTNIYDLTDEVSYSLNTTRFKSYTDGLWNNKQNKHCAISARHSTPLMEYVSHLSASIR